MRALAQSREAVKPVASAAISRSGQSHARQGREETPGLDWQYVMWRHAEGPRPAKQPATIQAKLNVGASGDPHEQEADRIADEVTSSPARLRVSGVRSRIPQSEGALPGQPEPAPPSVAPVLGSPGNPLEPELRNEMEHRFGRGFSGVRVHTDVAAAESARDVSAYAYTAGHDIVFGAGKFAPSSSEGRRLIAHELVHVVQQGGGAGAPPTSLQRQPAPTPVRRGKILSLEEIRKDPAREKARRNTGQTVAKVCRSISASAGKDNCPATLEPGAQVTVVAEKAGGTWLQIVTPEQLPGIGPREPLFVMAAFVEIIPAGKTPPQPSAPSSGPLIKDILRLDQTVPVKGLAADQPNYVDRAIGRIESAPLGPDITLIPRTDATGTNGISVLKGDFLIDDDPLHGVSLGQNQVYKTREIAEAVVADLDKQTPGVPSYAYYLRDGLIFPTTLSETTLPILIPAVRKKREMDMAGIKATGDLAEAVLWWYVGARFPIRINPGGAGAAPAKAIAKEIAKDAPGVGAAASTAFDAAKVGEELFVATKPLANPGMKMIEAARQLSAMSGMSAAEKVKVMLDFFRRIGFAISKSGVVDDGARLVMYSEDARYAFAFVKDTTEIVYGKFDMKAMTYVWNVLK